MKSNERNELLKHICQALDYICEGNKPILKMQASWHYEYKTWALTLMLFFPKPKKCPLLELHFWLYRVEWLKSLIGSNKKSNLPFKIIGKAWISLATLIENNSHLLVIILWEIQWNKNK